MTDDTMRECTISVGMLSAHFEDGLMSVRYAGNMGSSMWDVDAALTKLGLFPISAIRSLPSFAEGGHPEDVYEASVEVSDLTHTMRERIRTLVHKKGVEAVPAKSEPVAAATEAAAVVPDGTAGMLRDIAEVAQAMRDAPTLATADPRYWVVQQRVWRQVADSQDGEPFVWDASGVNLSTLEDFAVEWLEACIENHDGEEVPEFELGHGAKATLPDGGEWDNAYDWEVKVTDRELFVEDIEDGLAGERYEVVYRNWEWETVSNTMFLTLDACKEHIEANAYHYDHPRAYCMRAWRSPDVERLWKALKGIDWEAVIGAIGGGGTE